MTARERLEASRRKREESQTEEGVLPRHWSHSQLQTLGKCGVQYALAYVEKQKRPPGVNMIRGNGPHAARESALVHRIDAPDEEALTVEEVSDIAADKVRTEFQGEVMLTDEEATKGKSAVQGETVDLAVKLARLDREQLHRKINPVSVEEWMEWKPDGFPRSIVAVVDAVDDLTLVAPNPMTGELMVREEGNVGSMWVRDLKTGKRIPSGDEHRSQQLTIAAMIMAANNDGAIPRVGFDNLVTNKTPVASRIESGRTELDFRPVLDRISRAEEVTQAGLKTGAWTPAPEGAWWCDSRYCGYFDICPYARRKTSFGVGGKAGGRPR